ncbi:MAG: hypothetical protein CGU28_12880 [Candidatus Dactylopiibacterium carminicum]|uniref:DUF748 domain-containing protein n=1 Tax=Candidatus Dactylopiibacterium carminicum TaxID=857335 RepID=A0A272EPH4_9RHOO|nr:DUF748 domain-containing protein [Candidatus Dactylopiibacterium carminicum]KAF7599144.1 DUF748 domain-containing protein [Candidatus Dactylopiibacterium carminicum]PAS91999.1 MAG: hypothetical protein CGU29_13565 [Candidatus Dactylopiibacterium carminicum]PAS95267.1 MAG: hypothetical protein CGU28_12880 [Candidatus Dactylopiibacterium carminicum]PAS99162.1 MAG: hypothetical protein BSR46_09655 [Candidatus Dactylopiibacterium carminicum]
MLSELIWASVSRGRLKWPARILAVLAVLVGVLGFFVAPSVLKPIIEREASQALGRQVSLGRLALNPFALSVTLDDLKIAEADGQGDFIALGKAYVDFSANSLFERAPVIRELRVAGLRLNVARLADDRYNFSDLIERFKPAPDAPETPPARFALYNIQLQDGDLRFDDRVTGQQHSIAALQFGLPFVSNLPSRIDTFVVPHLSADIDGSPLVLDGEVKPFADRREAHLALQLQPLDLTRYLAYLPQMPLALKQGELGADLRLLWSEDDKGAQTLALEGALTLDKLDLKSATGEEFFKLEHLKLALKRVEPLAQPMRIELASLALEQPQLNLARDARGRLNLPQATADTEASVASKQAPTGSAPAPVFSLDELSLRGGVVHWADAAVPGGYRGGARDIELRLADFDLAGERSATLDLALTGEGESRITLKGNVQGTQAADLQAGIATLPLGPYLPYLRAVVRRGDLQAGLDAGAHILLKRESEVLSTRVDKLHAKLSDLRLNEPGQRRPLLQVPLLEVADTRIDLQAQTVQVGSFRSQGGRLALVRGKQGELNLLQLLRGEQVAEAAREVAAEIHSKAWGVALAKAEVSGWAVGLEDRSVDPAVRVQFDPINLGLTDVSNQAKALGGLTLDARVNRQGRVNVAGKLGVAPVRGELSLGLQGVDVLMAQPYVADMYRVLITRGQVDAKGLVSFDLSDAGKPRFGYQEDLALRDFNSLDTLNDTDFLRWKRFAISKADVRLQPLRFHAGEVALESFYTRLILDQQGRFNLRELRARDEVGEADVAPAPATASTAAPVAEPPAIDLRVGRIVLDQGDVNYSDRFVRPNYDAHLLRVKGGLEGLSSDPGTLATLTLEAALDGNAPVSVEGRLNPLRQDRYLDLKAKVNDVDLTGVSTYSTKYVGYGITRGRLSMALDYAIRDRQLTAQNQVFLDQLTFGDRVESPDAVNLPVKLGVALLKDRQVRIDLNLPVSGSLDDPQFSVGGVIWRVIVNLFSKAVTSPFSLLGSVFGGNAEELAFVDFAPGSASIAPAAEEKLKAVARALQERPALMLDVTGRADPASDVAGLKREQLEARLRAIKAEALVKHGQSVAAVDQLEIEAAEREALLREQYGREKFEKPRNAIGLVRKLPVDETERMILDHTEIRPEDLQALASRRAATVRNWLLAQGLPQERVFLLAGSPGDKAAAATRVDFTLR